MKTVSIMDVYSLEPSKKGKIYPEGAIIICLAAANSEDRNKPILLRQEQGVPESCAVGIPKIGNNSTYLHYAACREFDGFLHKHISGINLRFNELQKFEFEMHEDIAKQNEIAQMIIEFDKQTEQEEEIINSLKELKRYMLSTLFPIA